MCRQQWRFSKIPIWEEISGGRMYFPYAEKFLAKYPWLAVRVFYALIKIREFIRRFR